MIPVTQLILKSIICRTCDALAGASWSMKGEQCHDNRCIYDAVAVAERMSN